MSGMSQRNKSKAESKKRELEARMEDHQGKKMKRVEMDQKKEESKEERDVSSIESERDNEESEFEEDVLDEIEQEESEESQEDEEDGSDQESSAEGEVEVSFDFTDPQPDDYHSIRALLAHFVSPQDVDFNDRELADMITTQMAVGTMVRSDQDSGVYAFATVLSLQQHKEKECIRSILRFIASHLPQNVETEYSEILSKEENKVGILLCERMINFPPQLIPNIHQALYDDLIWAKDFAEMDYEREHFAYTHILVFSRCFREEKETDKSDAFLASEVFYPKFEDELLKQESILSFVFASSPPSTQLDSTVEDNSMEFGHMCAILSMEGYRNSIEEMKNWIDQS